MATYQSGNQAFRAAFDAAFPGLPECMSMEEAERRVTAALIAYDGVRFEEAARWEQLQQTLRLSDEFRRSMEQFGQMVQTSREQIERWAETARENVPLRGEAGQ